MASVNDDRRSRLWLAGLLVGHLLAISRQVDSGGGVSLLERTIFGALHPFQLAVSHSVAGASEAWHAFVDLRGVRQENGRLQAELAALRAELQTRRVQAEESQRLRALLDLRTAAHAAGVAAEVVSRGGLPWYRTLVVDRGSAAGVTLNATVVSPEGLVGRTIAVASGASKVQTLLDQHAGAAVLLERSRVTGVVSGQVSGDAARPLLLLKYVPERSDVRPGDRVVTSGLDRLYPKDVLVGYVALVKPGAGLFLDVQVTPATAFERLEAVLILPPPAPEPLAEEGPE